MPTKALRYGEETSLHDPAPSGKQKVISVRDELWVRVDMHLRQIEDECKHSVNLLASTRKESSFARLDKRHTAWGQYGPIQGNVGKHIDALAGVVYGYMHAIELLDEILGDDSIARRNAKNGKDQGTEEGTAERDAEEPATPSPRTKPKRATARTGKSKR